MLPGVRVGVRERGGGAGDRGFGESPDRGHLAAVDESFALVARCCLGGRACGCGGDRLERDEADVAGVINWDFEVSGSKFGV